MVGIYRIKGSRNSVGYCDSARPSAPVLRCGDRNLRFRKSCCSALRVARSSSMIRIFSMSSFRSSYIARQCQRRRFASSALFATVLAFTSPTSLIAQTPASSSNAKQAAPSTERCFREIRRLTAAYQASRRNSPSRAGDCRSAAVARTLRDQLDEERELLRGQLSTIDQTKVESGSAACVCSAWL